MMMAVRSAERKEPIMASTTSTSASLDMRGKTITTYIA
jgi:hypothetical protein